MKKQISLIRKYKGMIEHYSHTDEKWNTGLKGISFEEAITSIKLLDTGLRIAIGKTNNLNVSLCSHKAIIDREFPEATCRVCYKNLNKVYGRCNDYLVLRHPNCNHPICIDCMRNNPDEFHLAFKRGLKRIIET